MGASGHMVGCSVFRRVVADPALVRDEHERRRRTRAMLIASWPALLVRSMNRRLNSPHARRTVRLHPSSKSTGGRSRIPGAPEPALPSRRSRQHSALQARRVRRAEGGAGRRRVTRPGDDRMRIGVHHEVADSHGRPHHLRSRSPATRYRRPRRAHLATPSLSSSFAHAQAKTGAGVRICRSFIVPTTSSPAATPYVPSNRSPPAECPGGCRSLWTGETSPRQRAWCRLSRESGCTPCRRPLLEAPLPGRVSAS